MKYFVLSLTLLLSLASAAQKKNKSIEKIAKSITAADLKKHLYIVASAEMEGRDTPSPGLDKAASYIENHFRSVGLTPGNNGSYRMPYPLFRDSVISSSIKVSGKTFELNKDFVPANNYSAQIPFSEAVFAGYGIVDDKIDHYKDLNVQGKLVVILDGAPADYKTTQQGFMNPTGQAGKLNAAAKRSRSRFSCYKNTCATWRKTSRLDS